MGRWGNSDPTPVRGARRFLRPGPLLAVSPSKVDGGPGVVSEAVPRVLPVPLFAVHLLTSLLSREAAVVLAALSDPPHGVVASSSTETNRSTLAVIACTQRSRLICDQTADSGSC